MATSSRKLHFSDGAWTIAQSNGPEGRLFVGQRADLTFVLLLSDENIAKRCAERITLDGYVPYRFPRLESVIELFEKMAAKGVHHVAVNPIDNKGVMTSMDDVLKQLRRRSKDAAKAQAAI